MANQDGCNIDFAGMDHDQLATLASDMHDSIHEYAAREEQVRQWLVNLGYGLDTFAGEVAESNRFGGRKKALEEISGHLATFATLAYNASGVNRKIVAEAIEFSEVVDQLLDDPEFNKE